MTASHNLQPSAGNHSPPENPRFGTDRAKTGTLAGGDDVTIEQAAAALDLPVSTVRYWIDRRGCPTVRRGGRGRGNATRVDVAAVRAWLAGRDQPAPTAPTATSEHDLALMFAARLPALLAEAMYAAYCAVESPAKRQLAASVACAWYQAASAELDRLRQQHPDIPHVTSLPDTINKLKLIV